MVSRKSLLALLGVGVSAFVLSSTSALSATGQTFSPATDWAVSKVTPPKGGAAYCTLARRFSGNTVITIARNTSGEGTIAVDFQQPLFDTTQTYRIGLQAGNGLKRDFMTRPATTNAVVLRTGQDEEFFAALAQADEMGVILDTTRYAFAIPDMSSGTNLLTGCIGVSPSAIQKPAPVDPFASVATPEPKANKSADAAALADLRAQLEDIRKENNRIAASLKEPVATSAQKASDALPRTAENKELTQKLAALEQEKSSLVDKLQADDRAQAQAKAQSEQALKDAIEGQKSLKALLESERAERLKLESSLQQKTADAEKTGELRARVAALETSNADLKTLRTTLEDERAKRAAVEKELADQKTAATSSLEAQERLRTRISELEDKNKDLQAKAADVGTMQTKLSDLESRNKDLQVNAAAVTEMKAKLAELEARNAELQGKALASGEMKTKLSELQSRNVELQSNAAAANDIKAKLADLEARNKELQAQAASTSDIRAQLEDTGTTAAMERARREAAEKMLAEMQAASNESEAKLARMQKQLAAATGGKPIDNSDEARAQDAKIAQLNAEIGELQKSRAAAASEINRLKSAGAPVSNAALQELQQNADIEKARREAAEKALAEVQAAASQGGKMPIPGKGSGTDVAIEKARRIATENELQEARDALKANDQETIRLQKENAAMQERIAQIKSSTGDAKMAEVSDKLAELQSRNNDLMEQLQAAKAQNNSDARASMMTSSNDDATNAKIAEIGRKAAADHKEFQALLEAEKVRRQKLEAIMAQGKGGAQMDELTRQIADLQQHNADLEARLKNEQANMTPAPGGSEDVAKLQKQLAMLKSDNEMLAGKLASGPSSGGPAKVVYAGDEEMAGALAETKSSLESALAERDEYRNLLQRERINEKTGKPKSADSNTSTANARITELENERAELVRKLEFEKSRIEQIAAGKEAPPAAEAGASQSDIEAKLAAVESEKAKLQKQLEVTQADVIAARSSGPNANIPAPKPVTQSVPDADVAALLAENKKLQAELASSGSVNNGDLSAMQSEIAALRAQNNILSEQVNKRIAAAPDRAAMNNAAAETEFKIKEAKQLAQQEVAADVEKAQTRFQQAEAENIRLARELAEERAKPAVVIAAPQPVQVPAPIPAPAPVVVAQAQIPPPAPVVMAQPKVSTPEPMVVAAAQPQLAPAIPAPQPQSAPSQPIVSNPPQQAPAVYTPASTNANVNVGPNGSDIANYLKRAGIPMVSGFEKVSKVSGPQFGAFRWDTGVVFGTAEQEVMQSDAGFEQAVNAYLTKTKQRCSGTFDQSFDAGQMTQHKDFAIADVACVMPDGTGAGAAVLFYYKDGRFNVVAHEGDISQFDQAMTTRDSFARFMQGVL